MDDFLRLIAFYLPQFHPVVENDVWWGKGFTEWRNVVKGKPNFVGHYQPHYPLDLGFYDLRLEETRLHQANLAREYGVYGFCYYYYWFNKKKLLNRPIEDMLVSGKPFFPFCICWANENWTKRWDGLDNEVLISQEYSEESDSDLINDLIPLFKDERYIRVNSRPLFLVYRVNLLPNPEKTAKFWRAECKKAGLNGIYLCSVQSFDIQDPREYGFDAAIEFPPHQMGCKAINDKVQMLNNDFKGDIFDYRDVRDSFLSKGWPDYKLYRGIVPSWDNTARRKDNSWILSNSKPQFYKQWLKNLIEETRKKYLGEERMIFVNAWNEWGEGCHLEPDEKNGHAYLRATLEALKK